MTDGPVAKPHEHIGFWDERFSSEGYVYGVTPNAFLVSAARHIRPGGTVLAVADGEGRNGVWLARQGFEVHTVEGSRVAVEKATALAAEHDVSPRLEVADLSHWDWPCKAYDAVVAIFIQFAPPDFRARLFAGMKQALKPGGVLLLQGFRPEQIGYGTGGPGEVENLYDEALLRAAFGDLEILELKAHDSEIEEGAGHKGRSALIDLIARKPD